MDGFGCFIGERKREREHFTEMDLKLYIVTVCYSRTKNIKHLRCYEDRFKCKHLRITAIGSRFKNHFIWLDASFIFKIRKRRRIKRKTFYSSDQICITIDVRSNVCDCHGGICIWFKVTEYTFGSNILWRINNWLKYLRNIWLFANRW